MPDAEELTAAVKAMSLECGFARVGVATAGEVGDAEAFRQWLARGMHGSMQYLARNVAKRLRPDRLVDGARSVLCLAAPYAPAVDLPPEAPLVARYARGRDYHKVLKRRCRRLMDRIGEVAPDFEGRAFVDSAPVLERSLAAASGVGWLGRNHCLIAPGLGSYVLLCEVISNLPLLPDAPMPSQCRDCGACVAACPTGALTAAGLDARLCISYLTVEHHGEIDRRLWPLTGRRVVGCDACQEACPHNRQVPPGDVELRGDRPPLGGASLADILAWTEADWDAATRGSAARRAGLDMFRRNAAITAGNSAHLPEAPLLARRLEDLSAAGPELAEPARWALDRVRLR